MPYAIAVGATLLLVLGLQVISYLNEKDRKAEPGRRRDRASDAVATLASAKEMLEKGLITQDEFNAVKRRTLAGM
jgi:hypothetical protein